MYTIQSLKVGESVTLNTAHTIVEADAGKDLVNTITATGDGVSDSGSAESVTVDAINYSIDLDVSITNDGTGKGKDKKFTIGDVIKYEITATNDGNMPLAEIDLASSLAGFEFNARPEIPTDEAAFKEMTWEQIKELADDCASGDSSDYKHMVGWKRTVNIPASLIGGSTAYDVDFTLVALNHYDKTNGGKAGFTFFADKTSVQCEWYNSATNAKTYDQSKVKTYLNDTVLPALDSGLQNVIESVQVSYLPSFGSSGWESIAISYTDSKLYPPSFVELSDNTLYGKNGSIFDYFVSHNTSSDRIKNLCSTGNPSPYMLRNNGTSNNYFSSGQINTNGGFTWAMQNTTLRIAFCFCI